MYGCVSTLSVFSLSVALAPKEREVFLGDQFGVDRRVAAAFSEAVFVDSSFAAVQHVPSSKTGYSLCYVCAGL